MKSPNQYPLVSIITINFNQLDFTIELLESLQVISYPAIEIIVVDNASKEDPTEKINHSFPKVKVIRCDKNLGFAGGNNQGIVAATGKYLLFLNNDTEVEKDFLEPLVTFFEQTPNAGAVSPKIKYYLSQNKNLIQWGGSAGINELTVRGKVRGGQEEDIGQYDDIFKCELVHGAAMMIPFDVVLKSGLMPDIYFLYYEEHDWIERIKKKGYDIYYLGKSTVYHKESMSVGKNSLLKTYYLNRGRLIFTRRNRSGLKKILSLLFFVLISFPKNALLFILRKETAHLKAFWDACVWNLSSPMDIFKTPKLHKSKTGDYHIIDESFQQIKKF
ncbi:glycosyltransferase family 2 protein [Mongoliitalea lutea]|uniref:Glycosyl transferase n=1 Tax=Mongoliitalea lutea TaxID=849756 RepID=A0A8J3D064_9BACT|nr:glycosyltransferase family 2 protein [Mongoliitalea lutea]GHB49763.1 glycosyl transferase [Mongoliitalea lutea]